MGSRPCVGKPCPASNQRGSKDLNEEDFKVRLAGLIERLINDSALRRQLGEFGRRAVEPYLNRNVEKELKSIYNI